MILSEMYANSFAIYFILHVFFFCIIIIIIIIVVEFLSRPEAKINEPSLKICEP